MECPIAPGLDVFFRLVIELGDELVPHVLYRDLPNLRAPVRRDILSLICED